MKECDEARRGEEELGEQDGAAGSAGHLIMSIIRLFQLFQIISVPATYFFNYFLLVCLKYRF